MSHDRPRLRFAAIAVAAGALAFSGCLTRGSVDMQLPVVREKLPVATRTTIVTDEKKGAQSPYERRTRTLATALTDALSARGIPVAADEKSADVAVHLRVLRWEYNDAGFLGFGKRDDVLLGVTVVNLKTSRVFSRATVRVESDMRIFGKYVAKVWEDGSKPVEERE